MASKINLSKRMTRVSYKRLLRINNRARVMKRSLINRKLQTNSLTNLLDCHSNSNENK